MEDVRADVQGTGEVEAEASRVTVCQLSPYLGGILDRFQRLGLVAGRRQVGGEVLQELGQIRQVVSVYSRQVLVDAHELLRSGDRLIVSFEVVDADGQGVLGNREFGCVPGGIVVDQRRYRRIAFCATARTARCHLVSPSSTARTAKDFGSPGAKTSGFIWARWRYTSVASRVAFRASSERPAAFRRMAR